MARWVPGAQERLTDAALDLYLERGYDNVTVADIAERAGLTRRSYFRYFADKREVLFAGSEQLPAAVRDAVLSADPAASPSTAVLHALDHVGSQVAAEIAPAHAARRRAVIDASADLQERERTKSAAVAAAIDEALRLRGVDPATATLLAELGAVIVGQAFRRWIEATDADFPAALRAVLDTLRTSFLDPDADPPPRTASRAPSESTSNKSKERRPANPPQ